MRHPPRSGLLRAAALTCAHPEIGTHGGTSTPFGTGPRGHLRALDG